MLSSSGLLSHGLTDMTDKPLQYKKMTLPLQMGLMWIECSGEVLLTLLGDTQDNLLILEESSLCYALHLYPTVVFWKLSFLSESFHVLEINTILLSSIFFSMQSECGSFHFHGSIFFSLVALLNPTLPQSRRGKSDASTSSEVHLVKDWADKKTPLTTSMGN